MVSPVKFSNMAPEDVVALKSKLDLSNVDNTSDTDKPVSTAQQAAIDNVENDVPNILNTAGADTPVDADSFNFIQNATDLLKKITWANLKAQLKTYFDTLYNYFSGSYNDLTDVPTVFPPDVHNHDERYYTETEVDSALAEKSDTTHNHDGTYEPANANIQQHIPHTDNPHAVTAAQVGLGNVDNTSDTDKPVSTAQQAAIDNVESIALHQGVSWDSASNTYNRLGSLAGLPLSQSPGNDYLPIHFDMRRCLLNNDGTVNYYIDANDPIMIDGTTVVVSGAATSTSANELVDSGADFVADDVEAGMAVRNATDGTYTLITAVATTTLTLARDIFESGESYEIGTVNFGGADGQVMVEIPKFYHNQSRVGSVLFWNVSLYKLFGYTLHPAFWKDGQEVDYRYYSAFEGSMYDASTEAMTAKGSIATNMYETDDVLCSVAGQWAKTHEKRSEFREAALTRGEGWRQLDFAINSAVQLLYLIEYADFHTQGMIGNGRTTLSDGSWEADSYIGMTGLSIGDGNGTNSVSNGGSAGYLTDYMTYRGIENWYGNVWKMLEGITWDGRWTGVAAAQPVYFTNNVEHFKDYGSDNMRFLTNASYIGTTAGYISDFEETFGFIPSAVGSASLVHDYYWQYSKSSRDYWRVVLFGASADVGGQAGGFTLLVNNIWSAALPYIAGRLAY